MSGEPLETGRRRFLSAAAIGASAAVAGCPALWDQTGATDVVAHNAVDGPKTVSITITEAGAEEPHTSKTLAMPGGGTVDPVNDAKLPTNADYAVAVAVEGGPSETFEWADPSLDLAPLYVLIDDSENVKFLLQAG